VDGRTLLLLDTGDYPSINITTRLHIRRIQVEIDKRWPPWKREEITSIHLVRREKLKRQGELEAAAIEIQRVFRGHLGRKDVKNLHEIRRVMAIKKNYSDHLENGKIWWLEKINDPATPSLPSFSSAPLVRSSATPSTTAAARAISSSASVHTPASASTRPDLGAFPIGLAPPPPIPNYPLPPLKNFGKKRTYLSTKGWGGYTTLPDGRDVWKPLSMNPESHKSGNHPAPPSVSVVLGDVYRDTHITTYFSEKLSKTGYDRKREQRRVAEESSSRVEGGLGGPVRFRNKEKEKEAEKMKIRERNLLQPGPVAHF
jgi:hypothetical protein